ncbi:hypothetical protein QE152_g6804 [Popillia japonica]|uniref:Uncharacterized protein n=1 Tax=Popillia japonica TaxID=7064 RepID=A0AAW1MDA0_POPJA
MGIEPQEFFEVLERYFKIRAMRSSGIALSRKLDFAIDQLKYDVAIWAGSKRNQWTTLEDLKRDLLKMYWSDSVQKKVLSQLLRPGMYSPGRGSMTHHAWNNEEEDGQELTRSQFAIKASQEHNDVIAIQTDQDILKFRWERMQHEHKEMRLQDEADKEFEAWLGKLTEIQP